MNVVLDSNIIIGDYFLKSADFEVVFDYLARTSSRIVLPQIVFDEVIQNFRIQLTNKLAETTRAAKKLNAFLAAGKTEVHVSDIDIEIEVSKYSEYLK